VDFRFCAWDAVPGVDRVEAKAVLTSTPSSYTTGTGPANPVLSE
jgi:hypothetical protein